MQHGANGFPWHPRLLVWVNGRQRGAITAYIVGDSVAPKAVARNGQVGFEAAVPVAEVGRRARWGTVTGRWGNGRLTAHYPFCNRGSYGMKLSPALLG